MDNELTPKQEDEVNSLLDELLASPPPTEEARNTSTEASPLGSIAANPELLSKLPELISLIGPLLGAPAKRSSETDKKLALLCALKPYLSPKRCETVDYITKISKLGDTIKHIKL